MLAGARIVEIAGIGPGPFCAMHLADLGADVIAVERDESTIKGLSSNRSIINRGKRSIIVDIRTPAGRDTVLRLIENADAMIEGMRPGVMERLGLGPDECQARNPRLVYGRMTGWGQRGPLSQAAGHDNNYLSLAGAMYYNGGPNDPPSTLITQVGDIGGGALYLTVGILCGILNARSSGRGTIVDAAIVDGAAHMLQLALSTRWAGLVGNPRGHNIHDSSHFYATYRCADGEFVTLGSIEPQFHALLLQKLGLQDDPRFANQWDRKRWPELHAQFTQLFATKTRAEWCALLENTDACFGPVLSPDEAAHHPHNVAREIYFERDGELEVSPAPRFDGRRVQPGPVPVRGQHTQEILAALAAGTLWKTTGST
ncbi:MAG TPA: CaiB/BaiF CoA-transferase family protein [Povalibacter sp.]|uniref:CaiB/BaiF CoA transferase family protein n=1 Tax=Povalibacter sp. TaxID=1962978 RepID=UPI002BED00D0|nr:CaiB/BaiF CoA-transferase family protein [Povalibacter sp.]HMN47180.1 CaiB/BaiF CoA-transferase family protein [Povalibacter sp.]